MEPDCTWSWLLFWQMCGHLIHWYWSHSESLVIVEIRSFARHYKCNLSQRLRPVASHIKVLLGFVDQLFYYCLDGIVILQRMRQSVHWGRRGMSQQSESLRSLSFCFTSTSSLFQPFVQQDKKKKRCLLSGFPHVDVHCNPLFSLLFVRPCSPPQKALASRFGHMTMQRDLRSLRRRCWYSLSSCR